MSDKSKSILKLKKIDEIQSLITQGYKLTKISYQHKEEVEIKINFKRNTEDKTFITESWDSTLVDYFKKTFSEIGNLPFLDTDKIKLHISGWVFENFKITSFEKELGENLIKTKFRFIINLEDNKENQNFEQIDYRAKIELKSNNLKYFEGKVNYIHLYDPPYRIYLVNCEDFSCLYDIFKPSVEISEPNKNNIVYTKFISRILEMPHEDSTQNKKIRDFTLVVPIKGLNLRYDISIGKCDLISKLETSEFMRIKKFSFEPSQFARIRLKCESLYNAFILGLRSIQTTIDLINFRNKFPSYFESYDYLTQNSIAKVERKVYLVDEESKIELVINLPWYIEPILEKDSYIEYHYRALMGIGSKFIDPENTLDKNEQRIRIALYYLSSAEERLIEDRSAAFLELWIAIEYIIAALGPKIEKPFTITEIEKTINFCKTFSEKMSDMSGISINGEEKKRNLKIQRRLEHFAKEMLNNSSIYVKLEKLMEEKKIKLSDIEEKSYSSARDKRNDAIHGRKAFRVSKDEYNIISKIIYFILKEEIFKKIEIKSLPPITFPNPLIPLLIRTIFDKILENLSTLFSTNKKIQKIKDKSSELSSMGMQTFPEMEQKGLRKTFIPGLFFEILELIVNELISERPENLFFLKCKRFFESPIIVDDYDKLLTSVLENIIIGLEKDFNEINSIKEARSLFNQLSRHGMVSLRIQNVFKNFERYHRFEKLKKK